MNAHRATHLVLYLTLFAQPPRGICGILRECCVHVAFHDTVAALSESPCTMVACIMSSSSRVNKRTPELASDNGRRQNVILSRCGDAEIGADESTALLRTSRVCQDCLSITWKIKLHALEWFALLRSLSIHLTKTAHGA